MSGNELHEVGKDGKKADRRLHEEILKGVSKHAQRAHRTLSRARAASVLKEHELDNLYGKED